MSRSKRPRRPTHHDYRIGELVALESAVTPLPAGEIVQILGYRGERLRLLPIGGLPVLAHFKLVARVGLPCGSERPPHRRYRRRRKPSNGNGNGNGNGTENGAVLENVGRPLSRGRATAAAPV